MANKQNNFHQPNPALQGNGDGNEAAEVGAGTGDMLKAVYDNNDDGRVDSADYAENANIAQSIDGVTGLSVYYGTDSLGTPGFYPHPLGGTFIGAEDTPSSYLAAAGYTVKVNGAGTGLEFVSVTAGGASDFTDLGDVPSSYVGQAGKTVVVNGGETGLEFTAAAAGQPVTTLTTAGTGTLPSWAAWVADTSGGALSRAMPTSPDDGEEVTVHDVNGNAATNNITLTVTGPTTITQPTLNLDNQSKKWRYDVSGDNWDLVFNNAPSAGGGGSFLTNTNAHRASDAATAISGSAFATKGNIFTVNSAINLRAVAWEYDVSTSGANTFTFTVAKVSGGTSVIDEIVFQESVAGAWFGSGQADTMIVAMDLDLVASQDYAFLITLDSGVSTAVNRCSFPAVAGESNTEFTFVGAARYASSLPVVTDATFYDATFSVHMYFAYS